ncbi:restriction endonuclease subunit S [Helicobacter pylori]|uniref:restriction endonuclease subunit S n=1 Tax=Helicobacter pylori TaxID=210 RepID=UPI0029291F24|nr:restriction endonuclease subunit S [Helicobacter pylori]MDU9710528.1 restriction endonuclease subunit S [Helicobacter pylori]
MDVLMLPSNWQRVRLGDIAEIKRGASPRPIENPKWFCTNSNVGWVRISDISKNSRFLYKTAQKLSKKGIEKSRFIKQNSLIMSMCATIGKPIITKIDTCIHDGFVVFENPKIDLNYLYYFLCYIEKEWLESGQQGSQVNLNVDLIKNKEVFYPKDLNEQIAIANILSDVDHYLYSLDALILKKESVKKALSFELLSQRKRLKGFNQAWQRVRLGDMTTSFTKQTGFDYSASIKPTLIKEQLPNYIPFIQNKDFLGHYINYKTDYFIPNEIAIRFPQILLNEKCLLISIVGSIGNVAVFNHSQDAFTGCAIAVLKFKEKKSLDFVMHFLMSASGQKLLLNIVKASSHKSIILADLRDFEIPLPPLNEQIAIANILSALDHEIISLKNKKRQFDNIKKALNHDLMSAKIRVLKK